MMYERVKKHAMFKVESLKGQICFGDQLSRGALNKTDRYDTPTDTNKFD